MNLLDTVVAIADLAGPLSNLFGAISFIMGIGFAIGALMLATKRLNLGPGAGSWSQPLWMFIIGALFVGLPMTMSSLSMTMMGQNYETDPARIFEHAPTLIGAFDSGEARTIIMAIVTVVRLVGLLGVMRGLYLLQQSTKGQGPQTFGPGVTMIIAGIFAFNFQLFVGLMEKLVLGTA